MLRFVLFPGYGHTTVLFNEKSLGSFNSHRCGYYRRCTIVVFVVIIIVITIIVVVIIIITIIFVVVIITIIVLVIFVVVTILINIVLSPSQSVMVNHS